MRLRSLLFVELSDVACDVVDLADHVGEPVDVDGWWRMCAAFQPAGRWVASASAPTYAAVRRTLAERSSRICGRSCKVFERLLAGPPAHPVSILKAIQ